MKKTKIVGIPTNKGILKISYNNKGIISLNFPLTSQKIKTKFRPENNLEKKLYTDLNKYFSGKKIVFDYPLNLSSATLFQIKVWKALQKIPYGKTASYYDIAQKIKSPRALRAIGSSCKKNPIPLIIPCHRVIKKDKTIGNFSSGIPWKKKLLDLEKAEYR
jgi:methylated-DNA-[protein]-cysteine S-methyltransferase